MKRIFYAAIVNDSMSEIMTADHGEEWNGDVAAYLENLEEVPDYREGSANIPGNVQQNFGGMNPENICVVYTAGEPREIWFAAEAPDDE